MQLFLKTGSFQVLIEPHSKFDDAAEITRLRIFCNDAGVMLRRVVVMEL